MEHEQPALCRICRPAALPHRQRRLFGRGSRNHQARARPQKAQTRPHPFAAVGQAGLQDSSKMLRQYQRPLGGAVRGMRRRTAPSGDSQPQLIPTRGVRSCLPAAHRHPGICPNCGVRGALGLASARRDPLGMGYSKPVRSQQQEAREKPTDADPFGRRSRSGDCRRRLSRRDRLQDDPVGQREPSAHADRAA